MSCVTTVHYACLLVFQGIASAYRGCYIQPLNEEPQTLFSFYINQILLLHSYPLMLKGLCLWADRAGADAQRLRNRAQSTAQAGASAGVQARVGVQAGASGGAQAGAVGAQAALQRHLLRFCNWQGALHCVAVAQVTGAWEHFQSLAGYLITNLTHSTDIHASEAAALTATVAGSYPLALRLQVRAAVFRSKPHLSYVP